MYSSCTQETIVFTPCITSPPPFGRTILQPTCSWEFPADRKMHILIPWSGQGLSLTRSPGMQMLLVQNQTWGRKTGAETAAPAPVPVDT